MREADVIVDVIILGAGGAGLMCAIESSRRGRRTLVLDHADKLGGKILISGGGRCNFTNLGASPAQYVSRNPHFCKSAFSRYPSSAFIAMVERHGIPYHEKKLGQLFCDGSAKAIVRMLEAECGDAGAEIRLGCRIEAVSARPEGGFRVETSQGAFESSSLVVATGGLSIPKIGATGLGYQIARQFGLAMVETAPALDGFTFTPRQTELFRGLAGVSVDVVLSCGGKSFRENILFTHSGLSGPAALQGSLHWYPDQEVTLDLLPELAGGPLLEWLLARKRAGDRSRVKNLLAELLPARFAEALADEHLPGDESPLPQVSEKALARLSQAVHAWKIRPAGTVGYGKAEVTRGGVDTDELSSKTLEAKRVPGLHFIGEVVDVTGWLGGYNFQWAWASGWAAGQAV
jgi:predicted Rossmann fold flavoprotein